MINKKVFIMTEKVPFKTNGVYVYKLNPEIDLLNYKQTTKIGLMWKTAKGERDIKDFFHILNFFPELSDHDYNKIIGYDVRFDTTCGDIFEIVDKYKEIYLYRKPCDNLCIMDSKVTFRRDSIEYYGSFIDDFIFLKVKMQDSTLKERTLKMRFIPWL